jgi:hypothetical protein
MNLKASLVLTLAFVIVSSCGSFQEKFGRSGPGTTTLNLQRGGAPHSLVLDGDLMVYVVRADGDYSRSLHFLNEQQSRSVSVPNGNYKIYAVGWTGPNNLSGTTKCAIANGGNPLTLGGGAITVNLNLANANCGYGSTSAFADAGHNSGSEMLMQELYFCTNSSPVSGSCTNASSYTGGVRMVLYEYERIGAQLSIDRTNSLASDCYTAATGTIIAPGPRIPSGSMLIAAIEAHSDGSCSTLARTYEFRKGFRNPSESPGASIASINPATDFEVYFHKDF